MFAVKLLLCFVVSVGVVFSSSPEQSALEAQAGGENVTLTFYGQTYTFKDMALEYSKFRWAQLHTAVAEVFPDSNEKTKSNAEIRKLVQAQLVQHANGLDEEVQKAADELAKQKPDNDAGYYFALIHEFLAENDLPGLQAETGANEASMVLIQKAHQKCRHYNLLVYLQRVVGAGS